jgi:hypothetical protein
MVSSSAVSSALSLARFSFRQFVVRDDFVYVFFSILNFTRKNQINGQNEGLSNQGLEISGLEDQSMIN